MNRFPVESFETLGNYVYRLIDPRDGKTFYVGKGCDNRVFAHVNEELKFAQIIDNNDLKEDEVSAKIQTIRDIRKAGFQVKHVIHRLFYLIFPGHQKSYTLCSQLSWLHLRLIMRLDSEKGRTYS